MTPFEEAWQAYPRRVAKGAARKAWEKAQKIEPELLPKVLAALAWQIETNGWDGGTYTPHFSTYLNQERWTDEDPAAARRAKQVIAQAADAEYKAMRARVIAEQEAAWRVRG